MTLRINKFRQVVAEFNGGGVAVDTAEQLESRLFACERCMWRSGISCSLIGKCVRLDYYALDRFKPCPLGRWIAEDDTREGGENSLAGSP